MIVYSVHNSEFCNYGKVITGFPVEELIAELSKTPVPKKVEYKACDPSLQALSTTELISKKLFGGMPVQVGWCSGYNSKLDCVEYHRNSEFMLGSTDFILLLAKQDEIAGGVLNTSHFKAFHVPKGVLIECYATTLHYAPCHADPNQGFRVMIALPMGTNGEKPDSEDLVWEDRLLWACNKWVLAHEESKEAAQGAYVGLVGDTINLDVL